MQIAQIQACSFEYTPCSDAISGPKNRVFDLKVATIFVGVEILSRLSILRSMSGYEIGRKACTCELAKTYFHTPEWQLHTTFVSCMFFILLYVAMFHFIVEYYPQITTLLTDLGASQNEVRFQIDTDGIAGYIIIPLNFPLCIRCKRFGRKILRKSIWSQSKDQGNIREQTVSCVI